MVGIVRAGSSHAQSGRSIRYGPRWRARRGASRRQPSASGEGAALDQSELLAGCTIVRPFNPGHVRHVHRSEVRMKLAHRVRRPLRRTLPRPAARTDDEPARLSRARQRIMARRRQRSHQPQTHVPPGGTPAPAPRLSPPMPGGWLPAGPGRSSSFGAHRPRGFRPEWLEGPASTLKLPVGAIECGPIDHLVRPPQQRRGIVRPRAFAVLRVTVSGERPADPPDAGRAST